MKSTLIRIVLAGAVGAALLPAGRADAADGKSLHGSICNPFRGAETTDGQNFVHDLSGLANISAVATPRIVMCPIVRDNNGNTDGLPALKVRLKAKGVGIWCHAVAKNDSGSTVKLVQKQSAAVTGPVTIDFGNTMNVSTAGGSYAVQCDLPGGTAILAITYDEP
ncbi:MAG TPA: hypothetical protein VGG33_13820 [Polyangia bacterium]